MDTRESVRPLAWQRKGRAHGNSYAITVRGDVPANLAQRIQAAHAVAVRTEKGGGCA